MADPRPIAFVVDDDSDALFTYRVGLEASGFEVVSASSQAEAEGMLEDITPQVAVLDLMMEQPDSGFILAWRIKRKWPEVPVVLVSAVSNRTRLDFEANTRREQGWVHADAMLTKPVRPEQLVGELERLLEQA